jgi:hypothetical protein
MLPIGLKSVQSKCLTYTAYSPATQERKLEHSVEMLARTYFIKIIVEAVVNLILRKDRYVKRMKEANLWSGYVDWIERRK